MSTTKSITPDDYKRLFEEMPGGPQVLGALTKRFGHASYVRGGQEADRETCYRAGQRAVLDFILLQIDKAKGEENE